MVEEIKGEEVSIESPEECNTHGKYKYFCQHFNCNKLVCECHEKDFPVHTGKIISIFKTGDLMSNCMREFSEISTFLFSEEEQPDDPFRQVENKIGEIKETVRDAEKKVTEQITKIQEKKEELSKNNPFHKGLLDTLIETKDYGGIAKLIGPYLEFSDHFDMVKRITNNVGKFKEMETLFDNLEKLSIETEEKEPDKVGTGPEIRLLTLGLDATGKTTFLYKLKLGEVVCTIPTIGFNVETVHYKHYNLTMWDVGGGDKIKLLWRHYYQNTQGVIYMVDAGDRERISTAREDLETLILNSEELKYVPVVIFGNKMDLAGAMSVTELEEAFRFQDGLYPNIKLMFGCAITGEGVFEALDYIIQQNG